MPCSANLLLKVGRDIILFQKEIRSLVRRLLLSFLLLITSFRVPIAIGSISNISPGIRLVSPVLLGTLAILAALADILTIGCSFGVLRVLPLFPPFCNLLLGLLGFLFLLLDFGLLLFLLLSGFQIGAAAEKLHDPRHELVWVRRVQVLPPSAINNIRLNIEVRALRSKRARSKAVKHRDLDQARLTRLERHVIKPT